MAAKMAAKMKKTWNTFSMQYAHLSVDLELDHNRVLRNGATVLLDIAGVASRNDAYADVVSWVHRDADEGIMCGYAAHCSLRRSRWHHHRQMD